MKLDSSKESIQLLNTAILKSKEKRIDSSYQERLAKTCESDVMEALGLAITHLSEKQKISRDQSAMKVVETVRKLDSIWGDYIMMEGMEKLKQLLKKSPTH